MATRRLNTRQTNAVLAGAMGFALALAVAFFMIAMPQDVFERLIFATGLPSLLAAAEPPLGDTARMIAATLGGGLAGIAVFALFLIMGRKPQRKASSVRPFSASSDMVFEAPEPTPIVEREPAHVIDSPIVAEAPAAPMFVMAAVKNMDAPEILQDVPSAIEETKEAPIFLDFKAIRAFTQPANDPPALDLGAWKFEEPAPKPEPELLKPEPEPELSKSEPALSKPEPAPSKPAWPITAPAQIAEDEPIAALMQRLEAGLERRAARGEMPAQPPAINRSGVGLRSTLDELRQMAVRR